MPPGYLQGLVNAVAEMGWSVPAKVQVGYAGRGEPGPDLSIKLPSCEILVAVRELDERGRPRRPLITQTDYLTRTERTTVNKSFTASGRLEVTLTRGWEQHPVLSQRDSAKSTLEDQLPALIRILEINKAEADWIRQHAENTDPLNGPPRLEEVASCSHEETPAAHAGLEHLRPAPALGLHGMSLGHPAADLA